jgi:dihydropyrimidinase
MSRDAKFDLLLTGATVVAPIGPGAADIAIRAGRIAAIGAPGELDGLSAETIEFDERQIVVPGGIDPHIHCNWPVRDTETAGPMIVSRAALYGGTTTLIDFVPFQAIGERPEIGPSIERRRGDWRECHCDYSFHVMLRGGEGGKVPPEVLTQVPEVIAAGFPSIKIFTTNSKPTHAAGTLKITFGVIWELLQLTARHGGIVSVHAEDDDLVMHMYDKLIREGKTGFENMPLVHSALSEDLSFRRVIRLAESIEGASLYMMHVSAETGVAAIAEARERGAAVYGETLTPYSLRSQDDYFEQDGMIYHTYPSLKTHADAEALWRGALSGDIATFATDEMCTSFALKTAGRRIDDTTGGHTGVEPRLAIVYTEAMRRGLGLKRFVELTSTNAARILGLFPRKGVIAVGSDADLTVLDPNAARTITADGLHESDYTSWEGYEASAWPVLTLLRGRVVVDGDEFNGDPSYGEFLPAKLGVGVLEGAAVG